MEVKILSVLITGCIISIAGSYFTWKNADFFLTKPDYYLSSMFAVLKKKLKPNPTFRRRTNQKNQINPIQQSGTTKAFVPSEIA
jgi:hypothetical protein